MLLQKFAKVAVLEKTYVLQFSSFSVYSDKYKHFVYSVLLLCNTVCALRVLGLVH